MNFIIAAITALGLIIFFIPVSKNKSKFGIHLKRVYCPVCGTKQPMIRMPENVGQALYGGTTCPKCHANLDKYGDVIK
jgi:hypothetical protein